VGSSALCLGSMLHFHMGSILVHHWEAHSMSFFGYKFFDLLGIPWQQPGGYPLQGQLKTTLLRSVKNIYLQPINLIFQKFHPQITILTHEDTVICNQACSILVSQILW